MAIMNNKMQAVADTVTPTTKVTPAPTTSGGQLANAATGSLAKTPMKSIYDNHGNKVDVYTSGPNAGKDANGNLILQGDAPVDTAVSGADKTPAATRTVLTTITNSDGTTTTVYSDGTHETSSAVPGSTGSSSTTPERTLARDTFANTLALVFGSKEASQPYIGKLYDLVSGFYKTGSTVDEALNLAMYEANAKKTIPEFTKRFAGIFALQDQLNAGAAIHVPSIAEFFTAEASMGQILTNAGMGELATQDFLGSIIGKGKSVLEVGNLINDVFNTIDTAPDALKKDLQTNFPGVSRTDIATALLTGDKGAAELSNKVKTLSVQSAAKTQGLSLDTAAASNISSLGYDYQQSLTGFGTVKNLERANVLASFKGGKFTQEQAQSAVFGKDITQLNAIEQLKQEEQARMSGQSGTAKGAFATQYLAKQSGAGQY